MKKKSVSRSAFFNPRVLISFGFCLIGVVLALLGFGLYPSRSALAQAPVQAPIQAEYRGLSPVVHFDVSPALRDITPIPPGPGQLRENEDRDIVPRAFRFGFEPDPVVQSSLGSIEIPPPIVSFDGPSNLSGVAPSDPNGGVGPNHVVVMSNLSFQIFSKTGTSLFGPAANNTLWAGFGGACQTSNSGDPIVLYDQLADRWLLSQFTAGAAPFLNCVAISTSPDPTGTYFRYAFETGTTGANFPDYPKYGIWPDAYYISTREFLGSGGPFQGVGAYALNRAQMIAGNPSPQVISFLQPPGAMPYLVGDGLLPADLDGMTPPPAGSPEYFLGSMDNNGPYGAPSDALNLYKFHVDFVTPALSTFTLTNTIPTASFNSILGLCGGSRACIPQPGTTNKIDHLGYRQRPMHRLAYRNFGSHESLVTNQSVSAGTGPSGEVSGIRWWELRGLSTAPVIFQEGTFAPGLTDGIHRWMGSIAMDGAGNMGLAYSASNGTVFPSVFYTGRLAADPLGTMSLGENSIINGTGSQTGGGNRWGDYSAISVDPTDDSTFWFVSEYVPATSGSGWRLRIGSFKALPGGASPTPSPTQTPGQTPTPTATPTPSCAPSWSAGGNLPSLATRAVGNYFPANTRFYAMGGRSSDTAGNDFTHPFEYNPATNTWVTKVAAYPDNTVNNMACGVLTVGGTAQIYCVGGSAGGGTTAAARVFSYNPVTDTITALTAADNWPGDAAGTILPGGFAVSGNKLYIIGGFNIGTGSTAQTWQFDPTLAVGARWLQRLDYPVARSYIPAATLGGLIYTGGGSNIAGAVVTDAADSFKYDPVANTWTAIASIPRATGETRAVVVNNQMWVLGGGRTAPNPSSEVDIYTPGSDTWTTGLAFTTPRRNFPADSDGVSHVWLAGGYDTTGTTLLNTTEVYGPGACATPTPTPTPTPGTPTPTPSGTPTPPPTATPTPPEFSPTPTPASPTPPPATPTPTATPPPASPTPTPATPTPTATPAPASPTPTPATSTPTPTPPPAAHALNLSTRMLVQTGDGVGIGGIIITGNIATKRVIFRAIGPSLAQFGVPNPLADPVLELHGPSGFTTIINDNWRDTQEAEIIATGLAPANDLESAIVATLDPGAYTAIVKGKNNTTGVALVEVYDLNPSNGAKLANLSTRAFVSTGNDIVIGGFILGSGAGNDNIIVRGIGPSLTAFGVPNALADPTLELRDHNGTLLISDNDWQDNPAQAAIITAAGLAPSNPKEAAIAATLPPGAYTALLTGLNNGTGIGLVEIYDRGSAP